MTDEPNVEATETSEQTGDNPEENETKEKDESSQIDSKSIAKEVRDEIFPKKEKDDLDELDDELDDDKNTEKPADIPKDEKDAEIKRLRDELDERKSTNRAERAQKRLLRDISDPDKRKYVASELKTLEKPNEKAIYSTARIASRAYDAAYKSVGNKAVAIMEKKLDERLDEIKKAWGDAPNAHPGTKSPENDEAKELLAGAQRMKGKGVLPV